GLVDFAEKPYAFRSDVLLQALDRLRERVNAFQDARSGRSEHLWPKRTPFLPAFCAATASFRVAPSAVRDEGKSHANVGFRAMPKALAPVPECPLWVKGRHMRCKDLCPLYSQERPQKRTPARGQVHFTSQKQIFVRRRRYTLTTARQALSGEVLVAGKHQRRRMSDARLLKQRFWAEFYTIQARFHAYGLTCGGLIGWPGAFIFWYP